MDFSYWRTAYPVRLPGWLRWGTQLYPQDGRVRVPGHGAVIDLLPGDRADRPSRTPGAYGMAADLGRGVLLRADSRPSGDARLYGSTGRSTGAGQPRGDRRRSAPR